MNRKLDYTAIMGMFIFVGHYMATQSYDGFENYIKNIIDEESDSIGRILMIELHGQDTPASDEAIGRENNAVKCHICLEGCF